MTTKAQVLAHCEEKGIEVEDTTSSRGNRHIHLYAPVGFIFKNSQCHNAGAYDAGWSNKAPVNWKEIMQEAQLQECPDKGNCEYCDDTEDRK